MTSDEIIEGLVEKVLKAKEVGIDYHQLFAAGFSDEFKDGFASRQLENRDNAMRYLSLYHPKIFEVLSSINEIDRKELAFNLSSLRKIIESLNSSREIYERNSLIQIVVYDGEDTYCAEYVVLQDFRHSAWVQIFNLQFDHEDCDYKGRVHVEDSFNPICIDCGLDYEAKDEYTRFLMSQKLIRLPKPGEELNKIYIH